MQSLDFTSQNANYTVQATTDAINFSSGLRRIKWQVDLLNGDKSYKGDITPYCTQLQISYDNDSPVHRTLTLDMVETVASQTITVQGSTVTSDGINYTTDLVRPWCYIGMPDGGWVQWPLGTFQFTRPGANVPGYAIVRHAEMSDLSWRVLQVEATLPSTDGSPSGVPLYLPAGAYVIDVIHSLLTNDDAGNVAPGYSSQDQRAGHIAGIPGCGLSPDWMAEGWPNSGTGGINIDAVIAPGYSLEEGTDYLTIINQLLQYVKCYPLWVDSVGQFQVTPWPANQDYTVLPAGWTFDTTTHSIVLPGVAETILVDNVKNVVQVICEDPSRTPFYATARNNDPNSPYSVAAIGPRVDVQRPPGIPDTTSQNWAQAYANQQLMFAAYLTDEVTLPCAVVPVFEGPLDVISMNIYQRFVAAGSPQNAPVIIGAGGGGFTLSDKFLMNSWQISAVLPQPGSGKSLAGASGVDTLLDARNQKVGSTMQVTAHRITSIFSPGANNSNIGTS